MAIFEASTHRVITQKSIPPSLYVRARMLAQATKRIAAMLGTTVHPGIAQQHVRVLIPLCLPAAAGINMRPVLMNPAAVHAVLGRAVSDQLLDQQFPPTSAHPLWQQVCPTPLLSRPTLGVKARIKCKCVCPYSGIARHHMWPAEDW